MRNADTQELAELADAQGRVLMVGFNRHYALELYRLLDKAERSQMDRIGQAGKVIADVMAQEGVLHMFGTGHSHILPKELYVRVASAIEELLSMGIAPPILASNNVNGSQNARDGLSNPAGTSHEMD